MSTDNNEKGYIWDEVLPEIIEEVDWSSVTRAQWDEISKALNEHVSMAGDFMAPTPSSRDLFEMNERPQRDADKRRIADLEEQVRVYNADILRVKGGKYTATDSGRVVIYD